jgi:penicillin-binding protein 1A
LPNSSIQGYRKSLGSGKKYKLGVSKFKEWQTAVKLERSYTKEEIIAMYLNKYDFSIMPSGSDRLQKVYFDTTPDSLNVQQSAVLIGCSKIQAPLILYAFLTV